MEWWGPEHFSAARDGRRGGIRCGKPKMGPRLLIRRGPHILVEIGRDKSRSGRDRVEVAEPQGTGNLNI